MLLASNLVSTEHEIVTLFHAINVASSFPVLFSELCI